ncbi:MAG: hypothetical protein ACRC14_00685 [Paracoccaceae bacterium]
MKHPTDRRTVLVAAGAAALVVAAGPAAAQPVDVHGSVKLNGGKAIPEGHIDIYLEDLAIEDRAHRRIAETRIESDGGSKTIRFSVSRPASAPVSPTLRIVARLERADGWLIARGSVPLKSRSPVDITLNHAMY